MSCAWCKGPIPPGARVDSRTCSKRCRQARWRFGAGCVARRRARQPLRLAYADPPYPGLARRYYADHPDYAGEVDHRALLSRLQGYDGWALSTSAAALPMVLGLALELGLEVAVAAWVRGARHVPSTRPLSAWEPVVYAGGRQLLEPSVEDLADVSRLEPGDASPPGRTDALVHGVRARTTDPDRVIGAKPATFCWWLFGLLGAAPNDEFDDLFPGSGGVGRAWRVFASAGGDASPRGQADTSARAAHDTSPEYSADGSGHPGGDASSSDVEDGSPPGAPDASGRTCATGGA